MINVSKEFQLLMNERSDFKQNATITFSDGSVLDLTEKDFCISNNNVVDASDINGIPLGVAICRNIQIELMNDDDRFSTYDFFGAKIRLYLTFQLSETIGRIEHGTFTVLTPETYGETVIITALDDMHKANKEYFTSLAFPASIKAILTDACDSLDISLGTTTFLNDDFLVNEKPKDLTFRQLFGYIAMIAGGNARIDRTGRLRIITYDFANMASIYDSVLNGGKYNPWDNPVNIDGGSFSPWNNGDNVDGGTFGDRNSFHVLGNWSNLKVDTDDVVITGIKTEYRDSENKTQTAIVGADGYVLSIKNPLISGKESEALRLIGNVMIGGQFRTFSGDIVANPTCEFMDHAIVLDRKGNIYITFLTDVDFQFFGFTSIKNSAEPALRNSSKVYSQSAQAFVQAKELVEKEKTARETAVEQLARDLSNSSGLYVTTENQSDGSKIYYMHDKPTLKESMIVWKLTTLAFGISTDGGKTYPYGFTVDGETITRLLYADGIDVKNLVVGENVIMGPNAKISWENVTNPPTIPTNTNQLANGAGYTTMSAVEGKNYTTMSAVEAKGYQNASQVTQITKDTITTSYINALNITAGSVSAADITGDTFSGKKFVSNMYGSDSSGFSYTSIDGGTIYNVDIGGSTTINGDKISVSKGGYYTDVKSGSITILGLFGTTLLDGGGITFTGTGQNTINSSNLCLGTSYGYIGFFGAYPAKKQSVYSIYSPSYATVEDCANKINELLTALRAYNLIG